MNYSLWKSCPETRAIAAAISIRCEDHLYQPAVDGCLPLIATPAVQRINTLKEYLLLKRDTIEIELRVVLLVDSEDFGAPNDDPIMRVREIADLD